MALLDWSQCPAVESIPGKVSGAWVFRGTRLPVATVIENLEDLSIEEVIEEFDVTREQIKAVLEFAARSLDTPSSAPGVIPSSSTVSVTIAGYLCHTCTAGAVSVAIFPGPAVGPVPLVHSTSVDVATARLEA